MQSLFDGQQLMPHGMCYLWQPELVWLHVVSDTIVALSYFAIPPALAYLVWRARRELPPAPGGASRGLPFEWVFVAFGVFVLACGTTHALAVLTVWSPVYWVSGGAKVATAAASLATAVALPPLVPRAVALLKSAREGERHRLELEETHAELRVAHKQLSEADRLKTEFFANVSHELRTPLTLILGPTERLLEKGDLDDEARAQIRLMRRNALQLLSHVDDLLEASELEAGASLVRYSESDLSEVVAHVVEHFRGLAADREIDLTLDAPPSLRANIDRPKVERILLNLLSNAFKFTPRGGRIHVGLETREARPSTAEIVVEDDGSGVPEHLREAIFERFRQGDSGDARAHEGTGLGLAIARAFAEALGGGVDVATSRLGGAAFRVRVPLRPAGAAERAEGTEAEASAAPVLAVLERPDGELPESGAAEGHGPGKGRPRVLIVEDNPEMRSFLELSLSDHFDCAAVPGGQEALATARDEPPDLIVTDLMMPGMSGTEMLERLGSDPTLSEVPVLVLTARADPALPERLLRRGARDFVVKPVRMGELTARIENLLGAARARAILRRETEAEDDDLASLSLRLAERKRELEVTLEENRRLVQEVHHRVKGNLQTVASLLRLQLRTVTDASAAEALRDSQSRIAAIGLLHEKLYRRGAPERVDMADYLRGMVEQVVGARERGAGVDLRLAPVHLDMDQALPCALLAHELLNRMIAHGAGGAVTMELGRAGGEAWLRVSGAAEAAGELAEAREGPLSDLLQALSRQLGGSVETTRGERTRHEIRFPVSQGAEAA